MNLPVLTTEAAATCCGTGEPAGLCEADAEAVARDLDVLSHPIRLRLLSLVAASTAPICVCDLEAAVPVKQPTVSHHLKLLRAAGLVQSEKQGLWAYYTLRSDGLARLHERVTSTLELMMGGHDDG